MLVGGIIVATAVETDVFRYFADQGGFLAVLAVLFLFINLGSVCSHCLYNGAVGWSHLTGGKFRTAAVILGIIGIIAAVAGVWSLFISWLTLLGVVVPPIGAIIIVDQFILRKGADINDNIRIKPFVAWIIGSTAALIVEFTVPQFSTAIVGMIVAGVVYGIIAANEKVTIAPGTITATKL